MTQAITMNIVCDCRLAERLTQTEANQVRQFLYRNAPEPDRRYFDADELSTSAKVFQRAVDRCLSVDLVAQAIDVAAYKRRIAEEVRACARPTPTNASSFAYDYFNNKPHLVKKVENAIFVGIASGDWAWPIALGVPTNKIFQAKARGEQGSRTLFDQWLNAGHTLDEFRGVLETVGNRVLARELGLSGDSSSSAPVAPNTPEPTMNRSAMVTKKCAFAPIDEDTVPQEPTLGDLMRTPASPKSFASVLIELSEERRWCKWLESQSLLRGAEAERFVARLDGLLAADPDYNVAHELFRELVILPKYKYMTRSEFIESLRATKQADIVAIGDKWAEKLARTMSEASEEADVDREEHDIRHTLRDFFKQHQIFRGRRASQIERAVDVLTGDGVGIYEMSDLKRLKFDDLKTLGVFNINEASKVESAIHGSN